MLLLQTEKLLDNQQVIIVLIVCGFLLLAGLCLGTAAFTQLVELVRYIGSDKEARRRADQLRQLRTLNELKREQMAHQQLDELVTQDDERLRKEKRRTDDKKK